MNLKNLLPIFFFCLSIQAFGQMLGKQSYVTGFSSPVDIANAGDGSNRLFIVEKGGKIKIILPNKTVLPTAFLNITPKIGIPMVKEVYWDLLFTQILKKMVSYL